LNGKGKAKLINFVRQKDRMRSSLLFLLFFLFQVTVLSGQADPGGTRGDLLQILREEGPGEQVTLQMDSLLVANYYKLITRNMSSTGVPGYRIRIFSESGVGAKQEQQKVRARFLSLFPGLDAYNRYDEPYFKVYVGDCRTQSEALKMLDMIKDDFPNSIIREDYINIKSSD
jgi:hypothetical protein